MNGKGPADLREICIELSAWMFLLGGKSKSIADGRALAAEMIASGAPVIHSARSSVCKAAMRVSSTIRTSCRKHGTKPESPR